MRRDMARASGSGFGSRARDEADQPSKLSTDQRALCNRHGGGEKRVIFFFENGAEENDLHSGSEILFLWPLSSGISIRHDPLSPDLLVLTPGEWRF